MIDGPKPVPVLVGYLITHPDGYEVRMSTDKTRAEMYAVRQRGTIEPFYVFRVPAGLQASPVLKA